MKLVKEGSITVFLSLILLLILSVIMTTVEAARVNVARVFTERALTAAMDSVLAEFYLPLFNEYHIFALDSGYGSESMDEDTMIAKTLDYMEYTFEPNKDLYLLEDYLPVQNVNLFDITTAKIEIDNKNTLMDYGGESFERQAVSYMKYKEIGNSIDRFINNVTPLAEAKVSQKILTEKQKTDESLYDIEEGILELMVLLDGITIDEEGVKINKAGKIVIKDNFVKKICNVAVTKENVGIQNDLVFTSLEDHYVQPLPLVDIANESIDLLIQNLSLKDSARITYLFLTLIDQDDIEDEKELQKLKDDIKTAEELLDYYIKIENDLLIKLEGDISNIKGFINGTLTKIQGALPVTDKLIIQQGLVTEKIVEYESILLESKNELSEGFFAGLQEELKEIKRYKTVSSESEGSEEHYDFKGMKKTLVKNESLLLEAQQCMKMSIAATEEALSQAKISLLNARTELEQYSHKGLTFDYSSVTKPVESDDFFDCLKNLLEDGVMSLVVKDMDCISDKELSVIQLPSYEQGIDKNTDPMEVSSLLANMNLKSNTHTLTNLLDGSGEELDIKGSLLAGGDIVGQAILLQEYLLEHFNSYGANDETDSLTALDYELEYIIMGKTKDYDNLKAVITRILLIRTVMNLITLVGDSKRSGEARVLAVGFVGFTGLPGLISIIKMVILSIWSFAESLIDVAALLQNKAIPLLKSSKQIQLELQELFLVNQAYIKEKVENSKESNEFFELKYEDYLKVFIFLEGKSSKCFRGMDLIQENIQIKYEDTFLIQNCIQGFQINATFQMDMKFVAVSFVKQFIEQEGDSYVFETKKGYAY